MLLMRQSRTAADTADCVAADGVKCKALSGNSGILYARA